MRLIIFLFFILPVCVFAQPRVVSGPMYGHQTDSTAQIWVLVKDIPHLASPTGLASDQPILSYFPDLEKQVSEFSVKNGLDTSKIDVQDAEVQEYKTIHIHLSKTDAWRSAAINETEKGPANFSFLTGSCTFPYPYKALKGKDKNFIFKSMGYTVSDFMLWLGDNTYYLDKEWRSYEKMYLKNVKMRKDKYINEFIQSRPQYAIWDDHDFGPNDSDGSFVGKDTSLLIFQQFWANPSYGHDSTKGIFTHFTKEDVDFFLLDGRYHREPDVCMLGDKQLDWLKEKLKKSKANFKIIASGNQILPEMGKKMGECMAHYGSEKDELLEFLLEEKITGVIFLSGDRHYTELNYYAREDAYPLYEFTCSPITSLANPTGKFKNPYRAKESLYAKQNYGRLSFSGTSDERECRIEVFDYTGFLVWSHVIPLKELKPRQKKKKKKKK